jgi:hypothetical protein
MTLVWLGTAQEKSTHLTTLFRIEPADLPHMTAGDGDARTVRYFPDRLPIGIHPAGRQCFSEHRRGRSGSWFRRSSQMSVSAPSRPCGTN